MAASGSGPADDLIEVKVSRLEITHPLSCKHGGEKTQPAACGVAYFVVSAAAIAARTAVELNRHAERIGADAINVGPRSHRPPTPDERPRHHRANATAASMLIEEVGRAV